MSPLQAMERSYAALKSLLREGAYAPGFRLEANRIADEIGVSMTPVRDALNRLVGELLVESSSGDGFHVPRLSEANLRDLYEWHSALATMVVRTAPKLHDPADVEAAMAAGDLAEATTGMFGILAETAANRELRDALLGTGERLHPFRRLESLVLEPVLGELEELLEPSPRRHHAIRRYHLTRMRAVPELLRVQAGRI